MRQRRHERDRDLRASWVDLVRKRSYQRAMLNALTTAKARRRIPAAWVDARV